MRTARYNVFGVVYHVICRFADRRWRIHDDEERHHYLQLLGRALGRSDWRCLAYALMSNHIHLAMVAGRDILASWIQSVNSTFAQWLNRRHDRIGAVFAERPKDFAVRPDREAHLIAYIHNNPVRAGVVARACDSSWTSHRSYLGAGAPSWLDVEGGLMRAGFGDRIAFDAWVAQSPGESGEVDLEIARRAVRGRGRILTATPTRSEPAVVPYVARPFARIRPDPARLAKLAAEVIGVPEAVVRSGRRIPDGVFGRRLVVACGRAMGVTGADLAALLSMSPQGISRIAHRQMSDRERIAFETLRARVEFEADAGFAKWTPSPSTSMRSTSSASEVAQVDSVPK